MKFINGCYNFNLPQIQSDFFDFNEIYNNVFLPQKMANKENYTILEKAVSLYNDDYLADNDFVWAFTERENIREQFELIAKSLVNYYFTLKDYSAAQKVIYKLIYNNNLDETAHEMLLNLYIKKNNRGAFLKHYKEINDLFLKELGIRPSKRIKELYTDFISEI